MFNRIRVAFLNRIFLSATDKDMEDLRRKIIVTDTMYTGKFLESRRYTSHLDDLITIDIMLLAGIVTLYSYSDPVTMVLTDNTESIPVGKGIMPVMTDGGISYTERFITETVSWNHSSMFSEAVTAVGYNTSTPWCFELVNTDPELVTSPPHLVPERELIESALLSTEMIADVAVLLRNSEYVNMSYEEFIQKLLDIRRSHK